VGLEKTDLLFKLAAVFINATVVHDFGVGSPIVKLICGSCEHVELVSWAREQVTEPEWDGVSNGLAVVGLETKLSHIDWLVPFPSCHHLDLPRSQPPDELGYDLLPHAEGYGVGYIAQVGLEVGGDVDGS